MKYIKLLCVSALLSSISHAQTLNITSTGDVGPTTGTNWSISGNTLTVTGTANIAGSVLTNHLTNQGSLSVVGNTTSFTINVNEALSVATGVNGINLGSSGNSSDVTINSPITITGSITVYGGTVWLNGNIISSTSSDVAIYATNNVNTNSANVTIQSSGGNILLNSNVDDNGGSINLDRTTILSGGGDITLTGGSNGLTGYAEGISTDLLSGYIYQSILKGIFINGSTLNAGGGNIVMRGKGWQGTANSNTNYFPIGIDLVGYNLHSNTAGNQISTTGNGTITLTGIGGNNNNTATHGVGINFFHDVVTTTNILSTVNGAITLNGIAGTGTAVEHAGVLNDGGDLAIYSSAGSITINGTGTSSDHGFKTDASSYIGWNGSNTPTSGAIVISADKFTHAATLSINTTGSFTLKPNGTSFTTALSFPVSNVSVATGITGLTLGKTGNTANVTIASATSVSGPISLHGATIAINGAVTASASTLTLEATTALTQSAAITATSLAVKGAGAMTLNNTLNDVDYFAAGTSGSEIGNLTFVDADGFEVGVVGTLSGVYSTGTIAISSESGNITLSENISTTSTSTSAVVISPDTNGGTGVVNVSGTPRLITGNGGKVIIQ